MGLLFLSLGIKKGEEVDGVGNGTRTHDNRNHNPGLYQLSYSHHQTFGPPDRIRTCDPRLRRPMLYPAELRAARQLSKRGPKRGRGEGIRTPDILLPKQARYRTALRPASSANQHYAGKNNETQ